MAEERRPPSRGSDIRPATLDHGWHAPGALARHSGKARPVVGAYSAPSHTPGDHIGPVDSTCGAREPGILTSVLARTQRSHRACGFRQRSASTQSPLPAPRCTTTNLIRSADSGPWSMRTRGPRAVLSRDLRFQIHAVRAPSDLTHTRPQGLLGRQNRWDILRVKRCRWNRGRFNSVRPN